jgi:ligand-binding sensor domain-containing protein
MPCFSQDVTFLPLTKLDAKNGLSGINARKIAKDKFGFMWFATQEGVSRFDGRSYINLNSYNVNLKRKISGTDVFDIKPDVTGNYLWALSSYGGLDKIDIKTCNVVASYQISQSVKPGMTLWYKCFYETGDHLIIGTNEGIISRFNKTSNKTDLSFDLSGRFKCDGQLEDIMIDSSNRVWFFVSGKGILMTDSSLSQKLGFISSSQLSDKPFYFTDYSVYGNSLFLTTTLGLKILDTRNIKPIKANSIQSKLYNFFEARELHGISISDGTAVICGKNILSLLDLISGKIKQIKFSGNYDDKSWMTLSNAIFMDKQNIWIASQYGVGWIRNKNPAFVSYYNSFKGDNIKIDHAITICEATDSLVLICGDDGLYSLNHFTSEIEKFKVDDFYYSVFRAPKGYFIASGVSKGLQLLNSELRQSDLVSEFPELAPIKTDLLMCGENYRDSLIFMASQNKNGLYIWNIDAKRIDTINTRSGKISLLNDNINRLFIDSKKRLWIICENAVSVYDFFKKQITHLSLNDPKKRRH